MDARKISSPGLDSAETECFNKYISQIQDGQHYIEIGVYSGGSLCAVAMATQNNKNTLLYGIDPLYPDQLAKRAKYYKKQEHPLVTLYHNFNLLPPGCAQRIRMIPTISDLLIREESFRSQVEGRVGFLTIDGDHIRGIYEDIAYIELVPIGGTVAIHDYRPEMFPHICKVVDTLLDFGALELIERAESLIIGKKLKHELPDIEIPPEIKHHKW